MAAVRRGHVVVVEQPDVSGSVRRLWAIKRVAAVPGEPVPPGLEPALSHLAGEPVPGGHLVLLGDNREASRDSRRYGFIPGELLLGVVVRRLGG